MNLKTTKIHVYEGFMNRFALVLFAAMTIGAFAADTATVKGYLIDVECGREEGSKPGFGAKHDKNCLQMPDCVKSGYGVLTDDKKLIKFDAAGNQQAKKFISTLKKNADIKVAVTGTVDGESMTVTKIELQQ